MASGTEVASAYVSVSPNADGFTSKLKSQIGGQGTEGIGKEIGASLSSGLIGSLKGIAKIIAGAFVTKQIVDFGRAAVDAYADFEQLTGGVETLFGEAAPAVMANAQRAFESAGLSANDYMETVTSFSASLLQSLGGDTAEAAQMADMAITDMADNANKMGSDMSAIQNAYQGFAKQNYTMLDNLKLGYGGTQSEMQRLLDDAEAISGIHYELGNYADMVAAIHVIQNEMGITGTTAREASETISGSAAAMASAWQNLLTGFADESQAVGPLMAEFGSAVMTYLRNLLPRIAETLSGMSDGIREAFATLGTGLSRAVIHWGPGLVSGVVELVATLAESVVAGVPLVIDAGVTLFGSLLDSLGETIPGLLSRVVELVPEIATSLLDGTGELLASALDFFSTIVQAIPQVIPSIAAALPQLVQGVASGLVTNVQLVVDAAVSLLDGIVQAIPVILPQLVTAIPQLVTAIGDALVTAIPQLIDAGIQLLTALITAIPSVLPQLMTAAYQLFMGIVRSLQTTLPQVLSTLFSGLGRLVSTVVQNAPRMLTAAGQLFAQLVQGVVRAAPQVVSAIGSLLGNALSTVGQFVGQFVSAGANLIAGIGRGIANAAGSLVSSIHGALSNALNSALSYLGIASPSKLFRDEVGKWIPLGAAVGVEETSDEFARTVKTALSLSGIDGAAILGTGKPGTETIVPWRNDARRYAAVMDGGTTTTNNYYIDGSAVAADAQLQAALEAVADAVNGRRRMGTRR